MLYFGVAVVENIDRCAVFGVVILRAKIKIKLRDETCIVFWSNEQYGSSRLSHYCASPLEFYFVRTFKVLPDRNLVMQRLYSFTKTGSTRDWWIV